MRENAADRVDSTADDLVKMRGRVALQSSFPKLVGRQIKWWIAFLWLFCWLMISEPRKCLFHCFPHYWPRETHLVLRPSSRHN